MKQNWMNSDILQKMEERRLCKNQNDGEQYKRLKQEIQKLCREAKNNIVKINARKLKCWIKFIISCFIRKLKS